MKITCAGRIACLFLCRMQYPAALLILAAPCGEERWLVSATLVIWSAGEVQKVGQETDGVLAKGTGKDL